MFNGTKLRCVVCWDDAECVYKGNSYCQKHFKLIADRDKLMAVKTVQRSMEDVQFENQINVALQNSIGT